LAQIIELAAANDADLVTGCLMIVTDPSIRASSPELYPARTNAALARARATAARLGMRVELPAPLPLPDGDEEAVAAEPAIAASDGAPAREVAEPEVPRSEEHTSELQ